MLKAMDKIPFFVLLALCLGAGCSHVKETSQYVMDVPKTIWGSSTRALDKARETGDKKTYYCNIDACFDAVLEVTENYVEPEPIKDEESSGYFGVGGEHNEDKNPLKNTQDETVIAEEEDIDRGLVSDTEKNQGRFDLFLKNRKKHEIVVMGVPTSVDTTEVGIFFTEIEPGIVRVDVSSLSSNAKFRVSEVIFPLLGEKFSEWKEEARVSEEETSQQP
ncbi:MAG: hypothetical protein NUV91_08565 [Candidatus Omnitrophica bacterium]|nr:hypothetical protein [Candidatus Omnitrophota bacterium]